jgi:hypothetical protein
LLLSLLSYVCSTILNKVIFVFFFLIFICSGGDIFHDADTNYEEETFGLDDDIRDYYDNQASEKFKSTTPLCNYQSFMDKPLRTKWSKQDTETFYKVFAYFLLYVCHYYFLKHNNISNFVFVGFWKRRQIRHF